MPEAKKTRKSRTEKKLEKQLLWIGGFLAALVLAFIIAGLAIKKSNQFEYEGLLFTKECLRGDRPDPFLSYKCAGGIRLYHHYFYYKNDLGKLIKYNLYLRTDPRVNDIGAEGRPISFDTKRVFIALDTTYLDDCPDSQIAIGGLSLFLADNQLAVRSGNTDFTEAAVRKQKYVTCEKNANDSVIEIKRANSTGITINGKCMKIDVGQKCDILNATERFKVDAIIDAQLKKR